ncbi:MAG: hypothetical protein ACE367_11790 [Acidimicrobiales bacterium]
MIDDPRDPDRTDADSNGTDSLGADALERRLTDLGRARPEPVDPRFADRLESSIRAMHAEPRPIHRRYLVRPAAVLFAAVLAVAGVATLAVRDTGPDPIGQADQNVVARPSPTTEPTPSPTASPTAAPTPTATATGEVDAPGATPVQTEPTPAAQLPPVASGPESAEPAPQAGPEPPPNEAPAAPPAEPTSPSRPEPSPTSRPAPTPSPAPTATPAPTTTTTPTPLPAPSPQIVLSIGDRRPRVVTLAWSIDDPDGIAELIVAAAAPGGRQFADLDATARSVTIARPTDGPAVIVVIARDADGSELARSNRVVIGARR